MFLFGVAFRSQVSHNVVTQYIGHVDFRASLSGSLPPSPMLDTLGERDMVVVWVVRGKNIVPEQTWV